MKAKIAFLIISLVLPLAAVGPLALAQGGDGVGQGYTGDVPAPAFPQNLDWINTSEPLTWEMLRGKVVLLDFWTYGCINCMHIIPDLKRLEEEYADELVVIGVHSAKFRNEGDTENIRQIVQRYEIAHPVVNDHEFAVWNRWGVRAWPTVILIDPEGRVFGYHSGEGVYPVLQPIIAGMIAQFDASGLINRQPVSAIVGLDAAADTLLAFPGKVLADAEGGRLFVADSNHNRILVADLATYEVRDVIGGIEAGSADGAYGVARFYRPQGLALSADGRTLYVADTENHLLRAVDLENRTVSTLAGTGQQADGRNYGSVGPEGALNSPWDLVRVGNTLYIAMAGPHQLWQYNLITGELGIQAGSGIEGLVDGPRSRAQLAQPSGITTDGEVLYFADSEASAIRESEIDSTGVVRTLVGTGLFDFGDRDGIGDDVLLQHPLGVVYARGNVYVADTYNSKIRILNPLTREVTSLTGDPAGGYRDGSVVEALFDEPGGISYASGILYVADTNNHAIRAIDLDAGTVSTVQLVGLDAAQPEAGGQESERSRPVASPLPPFVGQEVTLEPQSAAAGEGTLTLRFQLPEGYKLNTLATSYVNWYPDNVAIQFDGGPLVYTIADLNEPVVAPVSLAEGTGELTADLMIFYCEAVNESLCFVERVRLQQPLEIGTEGTPDLVIEHAIVPPGGS